MPRTHRRLASILLLAGLILLSPPAVSGGFIWDLGIASGYVALALVVCLYIFPLRGDGLSHGRLLGLSQHRLIGWWILGAAILHVLILLASQSLIVRYLVPSAPLFMWCGAVAVILAGLLVQTGLSARSALRRRVPAAAHAPNTATVHIVSAALLVLTLLAHVLGSAQLISGAIKTILACLLLSLPLWWFAVRRRPAGSRPSVARRVSAGCAAALIPLLPSTTATHAMLSPMTTPGAIRINFPHEKHTSVNCTTCHHNYLDHTGVARCIDCHRSQRADLTMSSEATFHIFCRSCHARLALDAVNHGPTRSCADCHQEPVTGLSRLNTPSQPAAR